jgi:hypothetical protein
MAQEGTEEDGEGVMEYEVTSPTSKRILAEAQAAKVARRLLGPPPRTGVYKIVHAENHLSAGDVVFVDSLENARKCTGQEIPSGISLNTVTKGNYGWIQIKS